MPQHPAARSHAPDGDGRRHARPSLADQLENPRDGLDMLIRDLRLGTRFLQCDFDRAEERAQAIAAAIVAPFRGARPASAAPLHFESDGRTSRAIF
jgi:hypothetical protein